MGSEEGGDAVEEQLRSSLAELELLLGQQDVPDREEVVRMRDEILCLLGRTVVVVSDEPDADEGPQSSSLSSSLSSSSDSSTDDSEGVNELIGHRCRVPYKDAGRGAVRFHNALVTELVPCDSGATALEDLKVKVVFLNPLDLSMQTCKYYLDGNCTFGQKCKFCHGFEIRFGDLLDYQEPDFENVAEDTVCLVRTDGNSLWQLAAVTSVSREEGQAAVRLTETGAELAVNFENLMPLQDLQSASDDAVEGVQDLQASTSFSSSLGFIGSWEEHTRGIGTKLMEKMGFIRGQGLGKASKGRLEPIQVEVFSEGKSLDKCFSEKKNKPMGKRKRRKHVAKKIVESARTEPDIFSFINSRLSVEGGRKRSMEDTGFRNHTDRELNIKMLKLEEEMNQIKKRTAGLRCSVVRNKSRDQSTAECFDAKLSEENRRLTALKREADKVQQELSHRKENLKLKKF